MALFRVNQGVSGEKLIKKRSFFNFSFILLFYSVE